jgi:nucleotide-binding universal stress UspA family protein
MYERILFPTDGSEGAGDAFEHALDIAAANDATVVVLNVADTTRDSVVRVGNEVLDALVSEGERVVEETAERARERGVAVETETLQGSPAETIADYAEARGVDLVVMPTHGRQGLERLFLGSVTERVVRSATVPVLTVRPGADLEHPYRSVLVPTDGSDPANAALDAGIGTARGAGAALHVLSVVGTATLGTDVHSSAYATELEESAETVVEAATERATDAGVESVTGAVELAASVYKRVLDYAEEHDIDLIVVGTHGRTGLDRYLLGSVTEKLVRTAPAPVLTVRAPEE